MDKVTLERINKLHPAILQEVLDIYTNEVCTSLTKSVCRIAATLRTFDEQAELYSRGRTKLYENGKRIGIVTQAKAGQSIHNYGLAFDIVLVSGGTASWDTHIDFDKDGKADWMEVVDIFKKHGYTWGGDWKFKDAPHFEKTFGLTWRNCLDKYYADSLDNNGYIIL